jgi:AcrR family transcriptional regulator
MTSSQASRRRPRRAAPRRTRLSPVEIRSRLYEEALSAFRTRGFEAVTVSELTQVTGVAKGTFFNHFPTKDHILTACFEELWALGEVRMAREGVMGTDAVVGLLDSVGRALEADPPLARILGVRLSALPAPQLPDIPDEGVPLMDLLRDRFRRRLAESLPFAIPLQPIEDADLATLLVGALVEGIREGTQHPSPARVTLTPSLARNAVFLLRSAGFAAPDAPRS